MSFREYYKTLNSQTGFRAYIKKSIFNNLLKELIKQEKVIEKQSETIKAQEKVLKEKELALKKQERTLNAITRQIEDTLLLRDTAGLLIDMTAITSSKNWGTGRLRLNDKIMMTGIPRVVNNIFHEMYNQEDNVIPIRYKSGKFITSRTYLSWMEGTEEKVDQTVGLRRGDKLLLLDHPWAKFAEYSDILDTAADSGVKSYAIVHDLIPIQSPKICSSEKVVKDFTGWHNMLLQKVDAVVCVSRTTADAVAAYYEQMQFARTRPLSVYFFHLGSDVLEGVESVRDAIRNFVEEGKYTFLMVGTIEPRKGHMVALQALLKLPDEIRHDCKLLVIGKNGWNNEDVRNMFESPELKEKVLWIRNASDGELRWAYRHTSALIAASLQEGFGLPLVEAAYFGLPLICSDIPIFREVTQGNAVFFNVMDTDALAECLVKWTQTERHPDSQSIRIYSWQESAREFLDIMEGKVEPYIVVQ